MFDQQQGYIPKRLHLDSDKAEASLVNGIRKAAFAVKSTMGALGNTVLIESPEHIGGMTNTKDGVTVMETIMMLDPVENLATSVLKQAARRTAAEAGDGTTTAVVLAEALIDAGLAVFTPKSNRTKVFKHLRSILEEYILPRIKSMSVDCNESNLLQIATVSANNDAKVGQMVFDAYKSVGMTKDSIVTVEKSDTPVSYNKTTNGMKLDRGYHSPHFKNSERRDECIFEDTYVLVSDLEISNYLQIRNILEPIVKTGKKLVLIAPMTNDMVNMMVKNKMQNAFQLCCVHPPSGGYRQSEIMDDIAMATGATYFSRHTGDDMTNMTMDNLGMAKKVVVGRDSTVIIRNPEVVSQEDIDARVEELKEQLDLETKKNEKNHIAKRMASLGGAISQIFVGGDTDIENKELTDRVDDSVCAVRSALESGIIAGGGVAFMRIAEDIYETMADKENPLDAHFDEAYMIYHIALTAPLVQIIKNAEADIGEVLDMISLDNNEGLITDNYGYDIVTQEYGDMIEMGIIDPSKVAIQAITNALSVASTILSTKVVITQARANGE